MNNLDRRSFLSFVPAISLSVSSVFKVLPGVQVSQGTFHNINSQFIHPDTHVIHTMGYLRVGDRGHATYVSDHLATSELAALAPKFCTTSADGRRWRAALNADNLVPVAAGGALGSEGLNLKGMGNQQPIIAQALLYQAEVGGWGLLFNSGNFAIWCPLRTASSEDINIDKSGIPFLITRPTILQAGAAGTAFHRLKYDGSDPSVFHGTQYLPYNFAKNGNGIYWRGGMFMLVGKPDPRPAYANLAALHLQGTWTINGGISQSSEHAGLSTSGTPPWYVLNPDGSGWDVTDKPIWAENDRNTGDITFTGIITIGGFRGELIYQGGATHGSIYQTGTLTMHDTDGDGFNPGPSFSNGTPSGFGTVQIQSLIIVNAYQALEGATGWNGYINNLTVKNCVLSGGLMSGIWGPQSQPADRPVPILTITTINVIESGPYTFYRASHVQNVNVLDGGLWVSQYDWNTYGTVVENVTITADKGNISDGIVFFSPGPKGPLATHNNYFGTVTLAQTAAARKSGFCVNDPIDWFGPLGTGNVINKLTGVSSFYPLSRNPAGEDELPQINSNTLTYLNGPFTNVPPS